MLLNEERQMVSPPKGSEGPVQLISKMALTNDVPILLHDDFFRFAKETGSLPEDADIPKRLIKYGDDWLHDIREDEDTKVLSPADRFKHYNQMKDNWWFYSKGTTYNPRTVLKNHQHYSQDIRLFVNQEHGELFQKLYPEIYSWFFEGGGIATNDKVKDKLQVLANDMEGLNFFENFCKIYEIENLDDDKPLPNPFKVSPHFRRPLRTTLVTDDNERSYLEHAIRSIVNYEMHHRKEGSSRIQLCVGHLEKVLRETAGQDDKEAIVHLRKVITTVGIFLNISDKKPSYMFRQIDKLICSFKYFEYVDALLQRHVDKNSELTRGQKDDLEAVQKELKKLTEDDNLDYLQKLKQAKAKVKAVIVSLERPHDDSTIGYNALASAMTYFSPGENPTIGKLIKRLNHLNAPGFAETSIASDIAKRFEAYHRRNFFREILHTILSAIFPSKIPSFFSSDKSELAHQIHNDLKTLDDKGQGNNLSKVSKILRTGQVALQQIRQGKSLVVGELDNIMIQARADLSIEMNTFSFDAKKKGQSAAEPEELSSTADQSFNF